MTARGLRLVRGWTGAVFATSVAALSHVLAGGDVPDVRLALLSLALSGLICGALAGRVLCLWRLTAGVGLSQGLFHWLFSLGGEGAASAVSSAGAGHAGHVVPALTSGGEAAMSAGMTHASPAMWLSHAFAAVVTVAVLRHGEVTAVRLLRAVRLKATAFLPLFIPLAAEPGAPILPASWPVRTLRNLGAPLLVMRHRGPPLFPVVS
ncbi:hypothetical protein [uncultured Arthrobacter sp.]|uniref:hypothetical protein n=1 Tax=uncultured Arthrobacter sp. TaxID=114050 RepID=UPI003216A189